MAYTDNFPQRPVFMADFANGGRIDPRATFTRSDTPPTYAAPSAVHYWSNEKHESSQNLVLQSQSFDTTWTQYQLASSGGLTGSQSAPDGTTTAWLVTAGTLSPGAPFLNQTLSGIASSTEYTASVYLKAGTASHGYITLRGQFSHLAWVEIDFASPLSPTTGGVNFTSISATSTAVGSTGWYRLTLTCTTSSVASPKVYVGPSDGTDPGLYGEAVWNCAGETIYVWGVQLEERGSATVYNATTTQIHREYAPTLKSVATAGQPRFEYDPSTDGQSVAKGILIEGSATNLISYSESLSSWGSNVAFTVTDGAAVGPDGTLSASLLTPNTNNALHFLQDSVTTAASTVYTLSAYVKAAGYTNFRLNHFQSASPYTGTTGDYSLTGDGTATSSDGAATITKLSDGWYRITLTAAATSTTTIIRLFGMSPDPAVASFTPNEYSGILCTGVQFEANSFASSYIKSNSGSTTTRAAESLSMTDSGLFDNGGGTIVAEYDTSSPSAVAGIAAITDGAGSSNAVSLRLQASTAKLFVNNAGSTQAAASTTAPSAGVSQKIAGRYAVNDFGVSVNGGSVVADANGTVPVISKLEIGTMDNGSYHLNGHVKRVAIYPALSDTNLQALTS